MSVSREGLSFHSIFSDNSEVETAEIVMVQYTKCALFGKTL